ncbi:MAG TPA: hypothetical protein VI545_07465 [Burkholderiales bacterium]|nr:hypothetical protein [Burkholderiales bacterium]
MSQNINLFNPAFRKPRRLLTLAVVAQCLGITLAALFGYHYYLQQQVSGLAAELAVTEKLLRTQGGFVDKLKEKPIPPVTEAQLDAEIGQLEAELKRAEESIEALKGGAIGSRQGFAEYLRAFSRQSVGGLWLTGFSIGGRGELELRGRALSPDLLPSYIQRLNRERVLAGRNIARLEINRPKPEPVADKDKGAGKAARAPRFLDFSLATETAGPEKTP